MSDPEITANTFASEPLEVDDSELDPLKLSFDGVGEMGQAFRAGSSIDADAQVEVSSYTDVLPGEAMGDD